jgi:aldehyde:ferredoxin oxidoreductase
VPFKPGSNILDQNDMETAKDLFYDELGFDRKTGSPTKASLNKLNLGYVVDALAPKGLVPGA